MAIQTPGMIHEDVTHDPSRQGKELRAVPRFDLRLRGEPEIGFVDQGGGLERMPTRLACHETMCNALKLAIDQRDEFVEAVAVAGCPSSE
jgi:hypothetical protein